MAKEHFTTMEVKSKSGFTYYEYDNIKESSLISDIHVGKRVMVAGFKVTKKFYLKHIHEPGTPGYPQKSCTLITNDGSTRCFHANSCRLHPAEYKSGQRWKR
jgi:hypothetical protein